MTTTTEGTARSAEQLSERLLQSLVGAVDVYSIYLGEKLGYYRTLAAKGPLTSRGLAEATGTAERYAREWLEQQATTGLLAVEDAAAPASARRYSLPAEYGAVLVEPESPVFMAPIGRMLVSGLSQAPALLEAFRTGGGVSWERFGEDMRTAQADFNRPFFVGSLAGDYLANVPGLDAALRTPGARVAEIGPGGGWAAIAIARAYPEVHVDAFDLDGPTVEMARANVAAAGLADRVTVHHRNAGDAGIAGDYHLVCAFECVHDMSDPVAALATMRRIVRPGGTVLVMDEAVAEEFGAFDDLIERLMYGFSLTVCLPDGMSHQPSAATGTVMRTPVFRGYAQAAGFSEVEVLPFEAGFFRFYRLVV